MDTANSTKHGNRFIDITGKTFGRWTVIGLHSSGTGLPTMWLCRCQCGAKKLLQQNALRNGRSRSCRRCAMRRHGKTRTPEYYSWCAMLARCYNTHLPHYGNYGGRGISVCQRWVNSFEAFIEDMGMKPSRTHSIGRIDNNGDYSPDNCRWETQYQQARNTRRNRLLTYKGRTMCLTDWAGMFGINWGTFYSRVAKGMSTEEALETPVKPRYGKM